VNADSVQLAACALPLAVNWLKLFTGLSLGVFVFALVLGLFGQRGRAEITPERQVAIATGHADRRTVFEMPLLQPLMWLLLVAARQIRVTSLKDKVQEMLIAAGNPNFYTAEEYVAVAVLWGGIVAGALNLANLLFLKSFSWVGAIIGLIAGFGLSIYYLDTQARKRVREISRRTPYTLDLIALAMGAGATFTEAVDTVVREDPDHPLNAELSSVLAEIELGNTRAQALRNLADRIPLETLRSIVAAIIQAEKLGSPLADVLKQQASLLRLQRSVRAEKLAAAASVRILVPSMLILLSVVLAVFSPVIIRAVKGELL